MSRRHRSSHNNNNGKHDDEGNGRLQRDDEDDDDVHQQWCIISPGASECYFGLAGEEAPSFSVSDPWSSLEALPDAFCASNAPFIMRKFADNFLNNKPLVLCVPVAITEEYRARICKAFFDSTKISAICLLSESVSCSLSSGQTNQQSKDSSTSENNNNSSSKNSSTNGVTVIDLGWSHATTSFVEQGRTTKFVSSASLGLKQFFKEKMKERGEQKSSGGGDNNNNNNHEASSSSMIMKPLTEDSFNASPYRHEISSWYLSSSHLESMCAKMPLRALQNFPVVLVGGGGGSDGLGTGLSKILKKVVIEKKKKYATHDDDEDEDEDGEDDNDDSGSSEEDDDQDAAIGASLKKNSKNNKSSKQTVDEKNVRVSNIIRVPTSSSRLFSFRGASLLSSTGILDEMLLASIIIGNTSGENSSSSLKYSSKQKAAAGNSLGCVISREEWNAAVENMRSKSMWSHESSSFDQMLVEFLSWRFPK